MSNIYKIVEAVCAMGRAIQDKKYPKMTIKITQKTRTTKIEG